MRLAHRAALRLRFQAVAIAGRCCDARGSERIAAVTVSMVSGESELGSLST
jgi:hypothetical protein